MIAPKPMICRTDEIQRVSADQFPVPVCHVFTYRIEFDKARGRVECPDDPYAV